MGARVAAEGDVTSAIGRVLVPTDGPEPPAAPTDAALGIARRHGATVHALYVVKTDSSMGGLDPVVERREEAGEAAVEAVADRGADRGVPVEKSFRYGTPHEEIHSYVADHEVDLVVLGRRERSAWRRLLSPTSTVERVVRSAAVPVLVAAGEETPADG